MTQEGGPTRALGRERMMRMLEEQGIADAKLAVESELTEDIPQVARLLTVAMLWRRVVDPWRHDPARFDAWAHGSSPWQPYQEAADAAGRIAASGCSMDDLALVAHRVAAETVAEALYWLTGEGRDPTAAADAPGVTLVEMDADDRPTGRVVDQLHEDWAAGLALTRDDPG